METDLPTLGVIAKMHSSFQGFSVCTLPLQLHWDFQAAGAYI